MIKVPGSSVSFFLFSPNFPAFFSSMIGSESIQLSHHPTETPQNRPPEILLLSCHSQTLPLPQNSIFCCCSDPMGSWAFLNPQGLGAAGWDLPRKPQKWEQEESAEQEYLGSGNGHAQWGVPVVPHTGIPGSSSSSPEDFQIK